MSQLIRDSMVNTVAKPEAQLEDVMAAMDVVDTLRHEQSIAERELDSQGRRERLLQRLRELYTAQGIECRTVFSKRVSTR